MKLYKKRIIQDGKNKTEFSFLFDWFMLCQAVVSRYIFEKMLSGNGPWHPWEDTVEECQT